MPHESSPQEQREKSPLELFREEIQRLKEEEEAARREGHATVHLIHVNPQELTEEDRELWERLKSGALSLSEFRTCQKQRASENRRPGDSRFDFIAFIANKWYGYSHPS